METAIRWSQNSTNPDQRFLLVDVVGRSLTLCKVVSCDENAVVYNAISTHRKVPPFRAFDWSQTNEALVAVGQSSGEATVLRIDDGSQDTFSLPIRNQRYCNAVAFSSKGLLAAGLDKVRNDFCLNIWDLNQRLSTTRTRGLAPDRQSIDPLRKLVNSEPVMSVKFFADQPETLVTGIKGHSVRIYDLRESLGSPSQSFHTRCTQNLAIDPKDENYIASCYPNKDPTICIWDRRSSPSFVSTAIPSSTNTPETGQQGAALELKNVIDAHGSIWSLRFSKTQRGRLGVLSSTGHFKAYDIGKEFIMEDELLRMDQTFGSGSARKHPEQVYTRDVRDVHQPYYHPTHGRAETERVVSFDFMTSEDSSDQPRALVLGANGNINVLELKPPPSPICFSSMAELIKGGSRKEKEFEIKGPASLNGRSISQIIKEMRSKYPKKRPTSAANNDAHLANGHDEDHESSQKPLSSRQNHELLLSGRSSQQKAPIKVALTSMTVQRLRCEEGYRFDSDTNKDITSDDRWLQGFWAWVGRAHTSAADDQQPMVSDGLDLSYLGVHAIWNDDLGRNIKARKVGSVFPKSLHFPRSIESLANDLDIPAGKHCETNHPEHRRLCLHICGVAQSYEDLEALVKKLVSERQHTKAAALAVFQDEPKLAYQALRNNKSTQAHKMLAMAIAGASKGETDSDWEQTCSAIAQELTDPYARAILALVSAGDWNAVVTEYSLPLKYRVGCALRWLPDRQLTSYLSKTTREAIRTGDIEGIVLTGLSHTAIDLFQTYIRKTNDIQTAVVAMSFTVPRFITDGVERARFEAWRETYRWQISAWGLKIERVKFDIQSSRLAVTWKGEKLIKPPPQQVSLVCNYCTKPLSQEDANSSGDGDGGGEHVTEGNPLHVTKLVGTVCPRCRRHMPRCGICSMWLGMPDPASKAGVAANSTSEGANEDLIRRFVAFCANCNHGFHAHHAREWFRRHRVCPVAECDCICDR